MLAVCRSKFGDFKAVRLGGYLIVFYISATAELAPRLPRSWRRGCPLYWKRRARLRSAAGPAANAGSAPLGQHVAHFDAPSCPLAMPVAGRFARRR